MSSAQQQSQTPQPAPSRGNNRRGRGRRPPPSGRANQSQEQRPRGTAESPDQPERSTNKPNPQSTRARKFGGQLTTSTSTDKATNAPTKESKNSETREAAPHMRSEGVNIPDLTAKLMNTLKSPPYAECVICFAPIIPQQPTWACTVSEETNRCCWGVFHNKCIVAWSKKSMQETKAAFQARNEDRDGEWRCPGCQTVRTQAPGQYKCFCGAVADPKPGRLAMPHSCGMSCQRNRASCEHPCPLACHPGPCPPCSIVIVKPCYCGNTTMSLRCGRMTTAGEMPLACGAICKRKLQCGNHECEQPCHPGDCLPCEEVSKSKCYCGRAEKNLNCGDGTLRECSDGQERWTGRFSCEEVCARSYDCGKHTCKQTCHPHSPTDRKCPRSPTEVRTCACGKNDLKKLGIVRTACTDPLPCCDSTCDKPRLECDHLCSSQCHPGNCPPCQVEISIPCRCGSSLHRIPCWKHSSKPEEILCNKVCRALRNCGKHVCNRPCCALAHIKPIKGKGRQSAGDSMMENLELHECDLTCNKLLNCGLHRCERKDHKGLCPPCLQSSWDEMTCVCGNTTIMPPVPCGTQMQCNYPCNRPPPLCGHPKAAHSCHESEGCPPCPFLTAKVCACGKMTLPNVRCSQPKVSCGTACGKPLPCGFHTCQRMCHGDDCGACESVCGKDRKLCLPDHHGCTLPCHAPSACPELEPCQSIVTLECPCGRIKRQVPCGRSSSTPGGRVATMQPKCTSECAIAQRNARLAEALGIDPNSQGKSERTMATYTPELVGFGKANYAFTKMVEGALADFVSSERQTHALPHMPEAKRHFVYNLCKVYRIDCRMVDVEPQRSIELIRRIDTRISTPLLSTTIVPAASLGKLQTKTTASTSPARAAPVALPPSSGRAWAAVASKTSPAPSAMPLPQRSTPTSLAGSPAPRQRVILPSEPVPVDWEADD